MSETIAIDMQAHGGMVRLITLRSALKLEATTGMRASRISALSVAKRDYGITKNTKHGAWQEIDKLIRMNGGEGHPAITLPNGRVIQPLK